MISPLQGFDAQAAQSNFQMGQQIGNANSPFTALGQALKGTLDTYNAHLTAAQEQQNKLDIVGAQNQGALDVANVKTVRTPAPAIPGTQGQTYDPMNPPTVTRGGSTFIVQPKMDDKGWNGSYDYQNTQPAGFMSVGAPQRAQDTNSIEQAAAAAQQQAQQQAQVMYPHDKPADAMAKYAKLMMVKQALAPQQAPGVNPNAVPQQ